MRKVYLKEGAVDYQTKEKLNPKQEWEAIELYTMFAVITDGYKAHIIETKYIKKT